MVDLDQSSKLFHTAVKPETVEITDFINVFFILLEEKNSNPD